MKLPLLYFKETRCKWFRKNSAWWKRAQSRRTRWINNGGKHTVHPDQRFK